MGLKILFRLFLSLLSKVSNVTFLGFLQGLFFLIQSIDYKFIEQFLIDIDKESDLNLVKIIKNNEETIELNYDELLKNQNNFTLRSNNP